MRYDGTFNNYLPKKVQNKVISQRSMNNIEKRQQISSIIKAKEKIEEYQDQIFEIIDNKGLRAENEKIALDTALKVLEFVIPKKKSSELTVITRKIEDLICESIEEAEIIEDKPVENDKTSDK